MSVQWRQGQGPNPVPDLPMYAIWIALSSRAWDVLRTSIGSLGGLQTCTSTSDESPESRVQSLDKTRYPRAVESSTPQDMCAKSLGASTKENPFCLQHVPPGTSSSSARAANLTKGVRDTSTSFPQRGRNGQGAGRGRRWLGGGLGDIGTATATATATATYSTARTQKGEGRRQKAEGRRQEAGVDADADADADAFPDTAAVQAV
jgi:hypothetical protein